MAHSKPYGAPTQDPGGDRLSGELVEGEQRAVGAWANCSTAPPLARLHGRLRALRRLQRQVPLLPGNGDPNMPVGAAGPDARRVYRRYFTFAGKAFPEAGRRADMTREVLDQWCELQPVQRMPPLQACSAPTASTPPRSPMAAREIMDARSASARSTPTRSSARSTASATTWHPGRRWRHAAGPRGGRQGRRHRRRRALPARPVGCRGAAGHAQSADFFSRAARREPDRLRKGVPRRGHLWTLSRRPRRARPATSACSSATTTSLHRAAHPARRRWNSASAHRRRRVRATPGASPTASGTR